MTTTIENEGQHEVMHIDLIDDEDSRGEVSSPAASDDQWAWLDTTTGKFMHVYPSRLCVEMCFPDGGKHRTEAGEGKIVPVTITARRTA